MALWVSFGDSGFRGLGFGQFLTPKLRRILKHKTSKFEKYEHCYSFLKKIGTDIKFLFPASIRILYQLNLKKKDLDMFYRYGTITTYVKDLFYPFSTNLNPYESKQGQPCI